MEPSNNQKKLLIISSFALMLLNSALATPSAESSSENTLNVHSSTPALKENQFSRSPVSDSTQAPSASVPNDPALKKICDKTTFPSLCLSSIAPFFNGQTDAISILEMAIKATTEYTKLAIAAASELADAPTTPPSTASGLRDCKANYKDALDDLKSATHAISNHDIGTMNTMLSAVVTDYVTCDDGFSGQNPIRMYNEKLGNMASNCLALASFIK